MKQRIRLTESQLHNVIKESVKKVLNESAIEDYNKLVEKLSAENTPIPFNEVIKILHDLSHHFGRSENEDDFYQYQTSLIEEFIGNYLTSKGYGECVRKRNLECDNEFHKDLEGNEFRPLPSDSRWHNGFPFDVKKLLGDNNDDETEIRPERRPRHSR